MSAYPDTVFTNVESVAPDTPGTVLLGVSIAVQPATIPTGNAPIVARPWTWTGIAWTVLGRAAAGSVWQLIPSGSITVRPIPADPNEATWGNVIGALKSSIGATADMLAAGPAGPDLTSSQTIKVTNSSFQSDQTQENVAVGQKWVSLLLNLAAAPYPIPDKLQLTCFLELAGSTQYAQFLALPTFTADKKYDPSTQLPSTTNPPDVWEIASVNGLKMHSEFSHPEMGSLLPDNTLWLPPAHPAASNPLIADWQAHLYELLGPYLDTAHVLTTPAIRLAGPVQLSRSSPECCWNNPRQLDALPRLCAEGTLDPGFGPRIRYRPPVRPRALADNAQRHSRERLKSNARRSEPQPC